MAGLLGKMGFTKAPDPLQFARQADGLRLKGSVKKAIQLCQDGLKLRPDYVTGYAILARCLVDDDRADEAREALVEALRHEPHNIAVLTELAGLLEAERNIPQALNYYRQALAIDPLNRRVRTLVQRLAPGDSGDQNESGREELSGTRLPEAQSAFIPPNEASHEVLQEALEKDEQTEVPPVSLPTPVKRTAPPEVAPTPEAMTAPEIPTPVHERETDQTEVAPTPEVMTAPEIPTPVHERAEAASAPVPPVSGLWIAELFGHNLPSGDAPHPVRLSEGGVHRFYADIVTGVLEARDSTASAPEQDALSVDIEGGVAVAPTQSLAPEWVPSVETFAVERPSSEVESPVAEEQIRYGGNTVVPDDDETLDIEREDDNLALAVVDDGVPDTEDEDPVQDSAWEGADRSEADQEAVTSPPDALDDKPDASDVTVSVFITEQAPQVEESEEAPPVLSSEADRTSGRGVPEKATSQPSPSVYLDQFFTGNRVPLPFFTTPEKPKKTAAESFFESSNDRSSGGEPDTTAGAELTESMARLEKGRRKQVLSDRDIFPVELHTKQEDNLPPEAVPDAGEVIPTATLAELYVRQGLLARAISVYLAMVARDPTNPDIHKRLAELSDKKTGQGTS